MSLVGELNIFLSLQMKQMKEWIFLSQTKYAHNLAKKFGMENGKIVRTPISSILEITKYEKGVSIVQHE